MALMNSDENIFFDDLIQIIFISFPFDCTQEVRMQTTHFFPTERHSNGKSTKVFAILGTFSLKSSICTQYQWSIIVFNTGKLEPKKDPN